MLLLYEGRQIYFGPTSYATRYFTDMGYECPARQTTADFLTSLTNPAERIIRPGYEQLVPRSPDEFADQWRMSQQRAALLQDIAAFQLRYPLDGKHVENLKDIRRTQKARFMYAYSHHCHFPANLLHKVRQKSVHNFCAHADPVVHW